MSKKKDPEITLSFSPKYVAKHNIHEEHITKSGEKASSQPKLEKSDSKPLPSAPEKVFI